MLGENETRMEENPIPADEMASKLAKVKIENIDVEEENPRSAFSDLTNTKPSEPTKRGKKRSFENTLQQSSGVEVSQSLPPKETAPLDIFNLLSQILDKKASMPAIQLDNKEEAEKVLQMDNQIRARNPHDYFQISNFVVYNESTMLVAGVFDKMEDTDANLYVAGHLFYCGEEVLCQSDQDGFVAPIRMRISSSGVWWVEPPVIFCTFTEETKKGAVAIHFEMATPHPAYAQHPQSRYQETIRAVGICDILIHGYWDQNPEGTLQEELTKTTQEMETQPDSDIVIIDDDEDTNDNEQDEEKVESLNEMLMDREAINLWELMADEYLQKFLTTHLKKMDENLFSDKQREFFSDFAGIKFQKKKDFKPKEEEDSPTVVTPRIEYIMKRCVPQLVDIHTHNPVPWKPIRRKDKIGKIVNKPKPKNLIRFGKSWRCQSLTLTSGEGYSLTLQHGLFVRAEENNEEIFILIENLWSPIPTDPKADYKSGKSFVWKVHGLRLKSLDRTVLLACGDPNELVYMGSCCDIRVSSIKQAVKVEVRDEPSFIFWRGEALARTDTGRKSKTYRLRFRHQDDEEGLSFKYLSSLEKQAIREADRTPYCISCKSAADKKQNDVFKMLGGGKARIFGETYGPGDCVFLNPGTLSLLYERDYSFLEERAKAKAILEQFMDEERYPEADFYLKKRKECDFSRQETLPYMVARIKKFLPDPDNKNAPFLVSLTPFYRESDVTFESERETLDGLSSAQVFLPSKPEEREVDVKCTFAKNLRGRVWVNVTDNVDEGDEWAGEDADRLFCSQTYGKQGEMILFGPVGEDVKKEMQEHCKAAPPSFPVASEKEKELHGLELFAGAGGLSDGLHRAGIRTRTAVELNKAAAATFKKNNMTTDVKSEGVNSVFNKSLDGVTGYPKRGDFHLISGGPPCQGFSSMNMFKSGDTSRTKNMLVTSQLSSYDIFRPDYTLLENVQAMKSQTGTSGNKRDERKDERKGATVLNAIMASHLELGMQVAACIITVGAYGVAQSRNRTIIWGAAPERVLQSPPKPVYGTQNQPLQFPGLMQIKDNFKVVHNGPRGESNVSNFISDLPLKSSTSRYDKPPNNHFQRQARKGVRELRNHECRGLGPLELKRVEMIPKSSILIPEPNWQLLPNEIPRDYTHLPGTNIPLEKHVYKWGREKTESYLQIECECWEDVKEETLDKYVKKKHKLPQNTIVPSCMAHTKKWKNGWPNCYGRVTPHLWFTTITCNDTLTQNTGRILHPEANRLLTVRELARGQGFRDGYVFEGRLADKITQVGNAVPPPLSYALGREIMKSHAQKHTKTQVIHLL